MNYAPGPWKVRSTGGGFVIGVGDDVVMSGKAEADLISMAPELLEQLEIYVAKWEKDNPGWEATEARNVIAKAKGEL